MTRDEIEKMEAGPELDAEIAVALFGAYWKRPAHHPYPGVILFDDNGQALGEKREDGSVEAVFLVKFSTDIFAAWQVVEKIGQPVLIGYRWADRWVGDSRHSCTIGTGEKQVTVLAAAVPLAICRAALLVIVV